MRRLIRIIYSSLRMGGPRPPRSGRFRRDRQPRQRQGPKVQITWDIGRNRQPQSSRGISMPWIRYGNMTKTVSMISEKVAYQPTKQLMAALKYLIITSILQMVRRKSRLDKTRAINLLVSPGAKLVRIKMWRAWWSTGKTLCRIIMVTRVWRQLWVARICWIWLSLQQRAKVVIVI